MNPSRKRFFSNLLFVSIGFIALLLWISKENGEMLSDARASYSEGTQVRRAEVEKPISLTTIRSLGNRSYAFKHIFVVPEKKLIFCAFPKAGTTSFLHFVFQGVFGKMYPVRESETKAGKKYREYNIHFPSSPSWEGKLLKGWDLHRQKWFRDALTDRSYFRVMISRDPVERLISAFKNKLACGSARDGIDVGDRQKFIQNLRDVASKYDPMLRTKQFEQKSCLNFEEFIELLQAIGNGRNHLKVNNHFINQDCLPDVIRYDEHFFTGNISKVDFEPLKKRLGFWKGAQFGHEHSSSSHVELKPSEEQLDVVKWFTSLK